MQECGTYTKTYIGKKIMLATIAIIIIFY